MVGRGTSEVVQLRSKLQILDGAVWTLLDRVNELEERVSKVEKRVSNRGSRSRAGTEQKE